MGDIYQKIKDLKYGDNVVTDAGQISVADKSMEQLSGYRWIDLSASFRNYPNVITFKVLSVG